MADLYICTVTVSVGKHIRGKRYEFTDYTSRNLPLVLIDVKIASEKQHRIMRKYIIDENGIKGDTEKMLFNNIRLSDVKFSSKTQYEFDPKIH